VDIPVIIFSSLMAGAVIWLAVASRKRKIWKPKDPRSVAIIKLTLWSGLLTWMVFTLTLGVTLARWVPFEIFKLLGDTSRAHFLSWLMPIWIIFTSLMLIWAVSRFAIKRLRRVSTERKILRLK
jgi:hypothetical protein